MMEVRNNVWNNKSSKWFPSLEWHMCTLLVKFSLTAALMSQYFVENIISALNVWMIVGLLAEN